MLARVSSWLRQTTTVLGLSMAVAAAVLAVTSGLPWPEALAAAVASVVLLALPGQGDLAGKIGRLAADVAVAAETRSPTAIGAAARDALVLAGSLHPDTPVLVVPMERPAAIDGSASVTPGALPSP